jgi:hypothetical protein
MVLPTATGRLTWRTAHWHRVQAWERSLKHRVRKTRRSDITLREPVDGSPIRRASGWRRTGCSGIAAKGLRRIGGVMIVAPRS